MRRFHYDGQRLIVHPNGDLCDHKHYERKAKAVEAIWELIGEEMADIDVHTDSQYTIDSGTINKINKVLREA
jgi:hypothetical protein